MYQLEAVILIAALAAIAGLAIGILLHKTTSAAEESTRKLRKALAEAEDSNREYQQQVAQHFTATAHMLNDLTEKYKDVHHHLAAGADMLCRDEQGHSLLADDSHLKHQDTSTAIEQQAESDKLQPPLDYAPKAEGSNNGTLAEDYGLEKINLHADSMAEQSDHGAENDPLQAAPRTAS